MKFKVINLTRTPERLNKFKTDNPYFTFERFNAIDGKCINREQLVKNNIITEACAKRYTDGAIGVALSHKHLWEECAKSNEDYTILEDDAYLVPNFNNIILRSSALLNSWDFIFWGANYDQKCIVELSPGIAAAEIIYNFEGVKSNINNIKTQNFLAPQIFRTYWTVGLVCYTIKPQTARYLVKHIFPLRDYFDYRDNYGIDNSVIEELKNIRAGLSLPPIALTLNDRYNSTVQVDNYGLEIKYKT